MTETEQSVQTPVPEASSTEEKKARIIALAIIFLLVIFIILLSVSILMKTDLGQTETTNREGLVETGVLPGMTDEEIQERLNMIVEEGMFNASMNGTVHFADGYSKGDVRIENIAANHYACTVKIFLKNTNECILETGRINPGEYVLYKPLDRPLVNGAFDCTAVFTAYNLKTLQSVGQVNMDIIILVGI